MTTLLNTMTTLELAKRVGKAHATVLQDTENMLKALALEPSDYLADVPGVEKHYNLDTRLTMTLVTGYDPMSLYAVIKRTEELEENVLGSTDQLTKLTEQPSPTREPGSMTTLEVAEYSNQEHDTVLHDALEWFEVSGLDPEDYIIEGPKGEKLYLLDKNDAIGLINKYDPKGIAGVVKRLTDGLQDLFEQKFSLPQPH